ncbi:LOB domain-containing protein 40-like [Curcuma longa]|uniref:LOB domain-containing protein 40-like n=1 Tax=Curcuma longa TaxID=136217 RepID=UPI003D9ED50F
MRMSCNGCRVLRKGCSDTCPIRPCLQWIKSPEAQANATVFLAKFYGRAGLMNLVTSAPDHLRPAVFRSLLYEACGRIVNPVYGSVGLLWSGSWNLTQAAVEAVLKGSPVSQMPSDTAAAAPAPPFKAAACDIRHVSKPADAGLHKVIKPRSRFKRPGVAKPAKAPAPPPVESAISVGNEEEEDEEEVEEETMSSSAASHVSQGEPGTEVEADEGVVTLELTLGLEPVPVSGHAVQAAARALCDLSGWDADARAADLVLSPPGTS